MTDRGIIMSAPMVRALLDGRKTQTRRLAWRYAGAAYPGDEDLVRKPTVWQKAQPGDRIWVKETHWRLGRWVKDGKTKPGRQRWRFRPQGKDMLFCAPAEAFLGRKRGADQPAQWWKRPSIFMPKELSRLALEVTNVRRQKLKAIDGLDALAEGIEREDGVAPWRTFKRLWQSLHGPDSWRENPEVVALTFTVHQANIDQIGEEAA